MSNKIFDRYLVAATSQRIPMPSLWQDELGLSLSDTKQSRLVATESSSTGNEAVGIIGYRFQQDEVLQRGYVHKQATSMQLDETSKYLLQLYLEALYEHQGVDYRHYLQTAVYTQSGHKMISKSSLIRGLTYYIYLDTLMPLTVRILKNDEVVLSSVVNGANTNKPIVLDTMEIPTSILTPSHDEYFYIEIEAYQKARIVVIDRNREVSTPFLISLGNGSLTALAPSVGYLPIEYSDKLIPALADMQINENSPTELKDALDGLAGNSTGDRIKRNTESVYDIDENMGPSVNVKGA